MSTFSCASTPMLIFVGIVGIFFGLGIIVARTTAADSPSSAASVAELVSTMATIERKS